MSKADGGWRPNKGRHVDSEFMFPRYFPRLSKGQLLTRLVAVGIGATPIVGAFLLPFPGASGTDWSLRLSAGALLSVYLWWDYWSPKRMSRGMRTLIMLARSARWLAVGLVAYLFGPLLVAAWQNIPTSGAGDAVVAAVACVVGWLGRNFANYLGTFRRVPKRLNWESVRWKINDDPRGAIRIRKWDVWLRGDRRWRIRRFSLYVFVGAVVPLTGSVALKIEPTWLSWVALLAIVVVARSVYRRIDEVTLPPEFSDRSSRPARKPLLVRLWWVTWPAMVIRGVMGRGLLLFVVGGLVDRDAAVLAAAVLVVATELLLSVAGARNRKAFGWEVVTAAGLPPVRRELYLRTWAYDFVLRRPRRPDLSLVVNLCGYAAARQPHPLSTNPRLRDGGVSALAMIREYAEQALRLLEVEVLELEIVSPAAARRLRDAITAARGMVADSDALIITSPDGKLANKRSAVARFEAVGMYNNAALSRYYAAVLLLGLGRARVAMNEVAPALGYPDLAPTVRKLMLVVNTIGWVELGDRPAARRTWRDICAVRTRRRDLTRVLHEPLFGLVAMHDVILRRVVRGHVKNGVATAYEQVFAPPIRGRTVPVQLTDKTREMGESFGSSMGLSSMGLSLLAYSERLMLDGHYEESAAAAVDAVRQARQDQEPKWALMAYRQLVTLCEVVEDWDHAVRWLGKMIELFEVIRTMVADPDVHQDLADHAYEQIVDLLVAGYGLSDELLPVDRALEQMRAARARLSRQLNKMEETGLDGRDYVSLRRGIGIDFDDFRDHVRPVAESSGAARALEYVERARSAHILRLLGSVAELNAPAPYRDREESATREFLAVRTEMERVPAAERGGLVLRMQAALARLHELWNEIEEAGLEGREYVSLRRGSAIDFHGLRDHVRAITASSGSPCLLVEYFLTTKKLFAFLVRAEYEEPIVVAIDIEASDVESIGKGRPFDEDLLASLAPVVAPIANHAAESDLVWIVPHGPLHLLPLHAVPIGDQPLINRNPVFYTPSGSVMTYCERGRSAQNGRVLVLADPSEARPLRHVRREAEAISTRFAGADVVFGSAATKQTFTDKLARGSYDIVHLACHGSFEHDDPLRSGIELAGGDVVTVADVLGLRIDTGLVVLSACETGLGERRASDDLIGLTRSFIYAGSPSVVVSQWAVQDLSTAILMDNFYTGLAKGLSKAVALQQAQLRLRAMTRESAIDYYRTRPRTSTPWVDAGDGLMGGTSPERPLHPFADPYYWAPFTLVGRW